jgi:hypothetical protein
MSMERGPAAYAGCGGCDFTAERVPTANGGHMMAWKGYLKAAPQYRE